MTAQTTGTKKLPELLAPAGDIETFFTALEQGADAVYVGVEGFNARLRARNFSLDELARMVAYARGTGRRVYVTLNTVVKDQELPELVDVLDGLRRIGPDGLIIQEMGVWRLAREFAPELPLHASTQMAVHNLDGAVQAARMGFRRVVLARELTLEEIGEIRRGSDIELECFIHGAMCYSLSGQCNFSSYLHGKSANRGRCLQPCRRLYDVEGDRKPIFAPLDLNSAPILFQVMKAGVSSLKIEGRLKPAETTGQIVAAYRVLLDAWPHLTKEVTAEAKQRLRLAIGRKSSTGFYLSAKPKESMTGDGMSRSGIFLGKAMHCSGNRFQLLTHEIVKVGDRVNVQKDRSRPPAGFRIRKMWAGDRVIRRSRSGEIIIIEAPFPVEVEAAVVKVIDADAAPDSGRDRDRKWPKAQLRAKAAWPGQIRFDVSGAIELSVSAGDATLESTCWPEYRDEMPVEQAAEILSADSPEHPVRLRVTHSEAAGTVLPVSETELAALQADALQKLSGMLDAGRDRLRASVQPAAKRAVKGIPPEEDRYLRVNNLDEAEGVLKNTPRAAAIVPLLFARKENFPAWCGNTERRGRLILELPFCAFDSSLNRDLLADALKIADQCAVRRFFVHNPAHFNLLQPYRHRKPEIIAAESFHSMNRYGLDALEDAGVSKVVFPYEGDRETLHHLVNATGPDRIIVTVFGKVPLFRSRQPEPRHVLHTATVETTREDLLVCQRDGLTQVTPERDYSLRHLFAEFRGLGLFQFLYDLSWEEKAVKRLSHVLREKSALDPVRETEMNFERGLE